MKTWPQTFAYAQTFTGSPYVLGGDGDAPGEPTDCSRYVQVVMNWAGLNFTRTTYTQWADNRYEHQPALATPQPGWIAYFHVQGETDPGHVGIYIGNGQMIEAPHTGATVGIYPVPSVSFEHVIGWIVPAYGTVQPVPPPLPPLEECEEMDSVVMQNGDNIAHYRTPQDHLLEVTRKAGYQGQSPLSGLSIIDITAQWPQFEVAG